MCGFFCMSRFYITQCVIKLAGNEGRDEGGEGGCTLAISFNKGGKKLFQPLYKGRGGSS